MKTLLTLIVTLLVGQAHGQTLLFEDTFDRPDSADIDATTAGMSGSLAPLVYVEVTDVLTATDTFSNIGGNQLALADGPNASGLHLDHNFIDAEILTEGGFRVSMDIENTGTADQVNQRFVGFGVGMSAADLTTYGFDFGASAANPGIRGHQNTSTVDSGVADWNVSLIRTGSDPDDAVFVSVYENGVEVQRFETDDDSAGMTAGTLSVDFAVTSFAAGATVTPTITLNGLSVGGATDLSFTWDSTDSNYIGLAARQNGTGWNLDNLMITAASPGPPVPFAGLTATPSAISEFVTAAVDLDWTAVNPPAGATYEIKDGDGLVIDSGDATVGSGTFSTSVDGTLGDETFTIEISNTVPSIVATAQTTVTTFPAAVNLVAIPETVSTLSTDEPVDLEWTVVDFPPGATFEIKDGDGTIIDSGDATVGFGFFPATVDGTQGDETFTIDIFDTVPAVVASADVTVVATDPSFSMGQSALRFDETSTSEFLTLTLLDVMNFPFDATYEITDNNNGAVIYDSPTSDSLFDPLDIDITYDPSMGSTEFTVVLKDGEGGVIDTTTFFIEAVAPAPATLTNLFSDTYDRQFDSPDALDIDSTVVGMSGLALAPFIANSIYNEAFEGSTTADSIQINISNALQAATGAGMSAWGINHNFVDTEIATDGAFSVALKVNSILTGTADSGGRYVGFGIGLTPEEINAFTDENGVNGSGPRGAIEEAGSRGSADFYVSVSLDDSVQIFADGILVTEIPVDGDGEISLDGVDLRTDFAFADATTFAERSFVYYRTYCNNLLVASGYFQLTNSGANYVGFSARAGTSTELDDLVIATVSSSDMPYPGDPVVIGDEALLNISNLVVDGVTGDVTGFDLGLSNGEEGLLYAIPFSSDLLGLDIGVSGAGIGVFIPSGVPTGTPGADGMLSFPGIAAPAAFVERGFAIGHPVHWPENPSP
ncbi:MAG: hypothetical protein AAGA58_04125 [Verrucomicrobiota bacterium]